MFNRTENQLLQIDQIDTHWSGWSLLQDTLLPAAPVMASDPCKLMPQNPGLDEEEHACSKEVVTRLMPKLETVETEADAVQIRG